MTLTTNSLESVLAGLTTAQIQFRPTPDSWSIAGILEHMLMVEDYTLGPLQAQLAEAIPSTPEAPVEEVDGFIRHAFADRSHKVAAPSFIHPTGEIPWQECIARMSVNQPKIEAMLLSTRDRRVAAMPLQAMSNGRYQTMDGRQWALAVFAHNERHTNQILEWIQLSR